MEKIECEKCMIKDKCKIPESIKKLDEIIDYLLKEDVHKSNKNT